MNHPTLICNDCRQPYCLECRVPCGCQYVRWCEIHKRHETADQAADHCQHCGGPNH